MHPKLSSVKWHPFCLGLNVLKTQYNPVHWCRCASLGLTELHNPIYIFNIIHLLQYRDCIPVIAIWCSYQWSQSEINGCQNRGSNINAVSQTKSPKSMHIWLVYIFHHKPLTRDRVECQHAYLRHMASLNVYWRASKPALYFTFCTSNIHGGSVHSITVWSYYHREISQRSRKGWIYIIGCSYHQLATN